jgi:hypothetical protein
MNNLKIFTVLDAKADAYITPFFLPQIEQAVRTFGMSCSDEGHTFGCYPQDFQLYHVGDFDVVTGEFNIISPKMLITGLEARKAFKRDYAIEQEEVDIELKSVS